MNDPWDVKSVTRPGQYVSCMKINGVPLLPPVLSKECRAEMEYYKLLAKEVEKRISHLQPLLPDSDSDSSDKTVTETEVEIHSCKFRGVNIEALTSIIEKKIVTPSKTFTCISKDKSTLVPVESSTLIKRENLSVSDTTSPPSVNLPEHVEHDLPERDIGWIPKNSKCLNNDHSKNKHGKDYEMNVSDNSNSEKPIVKSARTVTSNRGGSSLMSAKSFTGSLIDIHKQSIKDSENASKLIRQRSYTVLTPSPQLLAHLEEQSLCTGVEVTSISMSESCSNLNSPKKRRSWDLETAKVKWSNMAKELDQKNLRGNIRSKTFISKTNSRKPLQQKTTRAKSLAPEVKASTVVEPAIVKKAEQNSITGNVTSASPARNSKSHFTPEEINCIKKMSETNTHKKETNKIYKNATHNSSVDIPCSPVLGTTAEVEDPAARVRELYERIQNQQLLQMANLVEKQKKEQLLLQQLFEEQNKLLYKQLKTICPKSPTEIKEAWVENINDSAPVSLSQVINYKPLDDEPRQRPDVPAKKRDKRDRSSSFGRNQANCKAGKPDTNLTNKATVVLNNSSPYKKHNTNGSQNGRHMSRGDNRVRPDTHCETSSTSEKDYEEPMLTDRTNDTLADLNITFTDDSGNEFVSEGTYRQTVATNSPMARDSKKHESRASPASVGHARNMTAALNRQAARRMLHNSSPTPQEREAATKIVAHAKGYLVRRLLATERIQETVQTIRDALLCALTLHQDRGGIRGPDVELHRRLIQQITAACYTLHEAFVSSSPAERCALISQDRDRRRALVHRQTTPTSRRHTTKVTNVMSQSHSGVFPHHTSLSRTSQSQVTDMTRSNYETFSGCDKSAPANSGRYLPAPRRKPWR